MECDDWQQCGHRSGDGCEAAHIWVPIPGVDERYEAFYFGDGEWDSRDARLVLDWEARGVELHNLRHLLSASPGELRVLGRAAFVQLATGWWCGIGSDESCGHRVGHPGHRAAREFVKASRVRRDCELTEGLIAEYGDDLAGELRLLRGWCPHLPFEKHAADESGNLMTFAGEYFEQLLARSSTPPL